MRQLFIICCTNPSRCDVGMYDQVDGANGCAEKIVPTCAIWAARAIGNPILHASSYLLGNAGSCCWKSAGHGAGRH